MEGFSIYAVQGALTVLVVGIVIAWLRRRHNYYGTDGQAQDNGTVTPQKGMAWFGVIVGIVFVAIGVASALFFGEDFLFLGPIIAVMGAGFIIFLLPSLGSDHDVVWTAQTIEGPAKVTGPALARVRARINWADISKIGSAQQSFRFVETGDGTRIYWEVGAQNFLNFEATVKQRRPDLIWPRLL